MTAITSEWTDLLQRRPSFREALEPLGRIVEAWQRASRDGLRPLPWDASRARTLWAAGEPLLAAGAPPIAPEDVEPMLLPALDLLAGFEDTTDFVAAWDRGEIGPASLLPAGGRLGAPGVAERSQLTPMAVALLAVSGLRPALTAYFAECRRHIEDGSWARGVCPCCGGPPGCADLLEDGRRQLACHLCDTRWTFARLVCPLCGSRETDGLVRLIGDGADEGFAIAACRECRGYVKEIDRRSRWNAGPAIVEDWGTPHLDLVADRQEYWRPVPTLIQLMRLKR
jgi:hypothetical protein